MANDKDIEKFLEGASAWNRFRLDFPQVRPDLSNADLRDEVQKKRRASGEQNMLRPLELDEIDLSGTNLQDTVFGDARMNGADLTYANLNGAYLGNAVLVNAKVYKSQLVRTDFIDADLSHADVSGSDLSDAKLLGTTLTGAKFISADLSGADLRRAILTDAKMQMANLSSANLQNAILEDANLSGAILNSSNMDFAELSKANLLNTDLSTASLQGVDLLSAHIFPDSTWPPKPFPWRTSDETQFAVRSIEDLLRLVRKIQNHYRTYKYDVSFYFRGDSRSDWDLCPSIMRTVQAPTPPPFWYELHLPDSATTIDTLDADELLDYAQLFGISVVGSNLKGVNWPRVGPSAICWLNLFRGDQKISRHCHLHWPNGWWPSTMVFPRDYWTSPKIYWWPCILRVAEILVGTAVFTFLLPRGHW